MSELIKELNSGRVIKELFSDINSIPFKELIADKNILSFQVIKDLEGTKKTFNCSVSSVRKKDQMEEQKRKKLELTTLRQMKKEYLSKRIISLPNKYMIMLSGLTIKAQEVFWVLYDSTENIDCNIIADKCNSKVVTINCAIKELKNCGLITRVGSKKTGHYEIIEDARNQ